MQKSNTVRMYSFSDAHLIRLASVMADSLTRDLAELESWGITTQKIANLSNSREAFLNVPEDAVLEGRQMIATEQKAAARAILIATYNRLLCAVENVFGKSSINYLRYGGGGVGQMSEEKLVRHARRAHQVLLGLLPELASEAVTLAEAQQFEQHLQAFDHAIDNQLTAIHERDITTIIRIEAGNALYTELSKLSNTAKTYWRDRNEAYYNDYVLY